MNDPYLVVRGDTVASVAKYAGMTPEELRRLNHLGLKETIATGETLYLSERTSFGFTTLFLDALRHPIENLPYQLCFDGQVVSGKTPSNGMVPRKITKSADSTIEVLTQNAQGVWQQVNSTKSGYGHKLITLVSGAVVVPGKTELHPTGVATQPMPPAGAAPSAKPTPTSQASPPKPATGTPSKNNPAVKTNTAKTPLGQPVLQISVDIPQGLLDHFAKFTGGEITDADWTVVAGALGCEAAVLKAISVVESGGSSSFWRLNKGDGANIPAILFERHYFSKKTGGVYDETYPDISWPVGYLRKMPKDKHNKTMPFGEVEDLDLYSNKVSSYLRLIEAYRLDKDAALRSCSWGKFQVMGENFKLCGAASLEEFVNAMCTSEYQQMTLLAGFIQTKPQAWKNPKNHALGKESSLWDAVKTKNWAAIAFNYNGPGYATGHYDSKLKTAYEKFVPPEKIAEQKRA